MNINIKKEYIGSKFIVAFSLIAITFLLAMKSRLDIFTKAGDPGTDSSVFRYIGWVMTTGEVPYRDTFDHKGPLLYFINWVGTLFARIRGVWIIEIVFLLMTVILVYKIARRFTSRGYSLLVVLLSLAQMNSYFETGNLAEEYALPFQLASLYVFIDYFLKPDHYENTNGDSYCHFLYLGTHWFNVGVFLCGICFSATFLLRANMIAIWLAFCMSVFVCCICKKQYQILWKFILSFLLGSLLVALPFLLYLIKNHALNDFLDSYIYFNALYSADKLRVTLATKTNAFINFLNILPAILSVVVIVLRIKVGRKVNNLFAFDCGYLIYIILNLLLIAMSGQTYPHYGMTMCPMFVYPFCVMCEQLEKDSWRKIKIDIIVVSYLLITFVIPNWLTIFNSAITDISNGYNSETNGWYDNEIVKYILKHTEENDCISVYGNNNAIYLYTERHSASKYSYQNPIGRIDPHIMEQYFEDLRRVQPPIIVLASSDQVILDYLEKNEYYCVLDGKQPVYQKQVKNHTEKP